MKILITGGTGLLGKALIESKDNKDEIVATYLGDYTMADYEGIKYWKLDIMDLVGHLRIFKDFKPDLVIHTASIGSPDFAEKNREITWAINVEGTRGLIRLCENFGAKFIYISSNGIYDGDHAPYAEDDLASPINYYGETKLAGERIAMEAGIAAAVVRPILMYGWNHAFERQNIVTLSLAKLKKGEELFVYDDVFSNPLFAPQCAQAIWAMIRSSNYTSFNLAGAERVSICDLIRQAAAIFGLDERLVKPVKQGYFNELVPRPKDTSYLTDKMDKVLGLKPLSLQEGLQMMKERQR